MQKNRWNVNTAWQALYVKRPQVVLGNVQWRALQEYTSRQYTT